MDDGYKVMVARFPHGACDHPDVTDYLVRLIVKMNTIPYIQDITTYRKDNTPITMGRNHCLSRAMQAEVDFLLMLDADMCPDSHLVGNPYAQAQDKNAQPFFETSFEFLRQRRLAGQPPGMVVSPYCGPPPIENVYVFQWCVASNDLPEDANMYSLEQYSREHAAALTGIQECAAGPTGLILIDMQCIQHLEPPHTYYEWESPEELAKCSTEDVTFTRDCSLQGFPVFCNWDAWSGHWKRKCVLKPEPIGPEYIGDKFRRAAFRHAGMTPEGEIRGVVKNGRVVIPERVSLSVASLEKGNGQERSPAPAEHH